MPARGAVQAGRLPRDPRNQYRELHWGNNPKRVLSLNVPALVVPQTLVKLGILEALVLETKQGPFTLKPMRPLPLLLVGATDNRLYIAGGTTDAMARTRAWGSPGSEWPIARVDYSANKAGEYVYWYHDHDTPYPRLRILPTGHPAIVGGRYTVEPEGITG